MADQVVHLFTSRYNLTFRADITLREARDRLYGPADRAELSVLQSMSGDEGGPVFPAQSVDCSLDAAAAQRLSAYFSHLARVLARAEEPPR